MSDLLRFEISQVFFLENLCDVSIRMHECVKICVCALRDSLLCCVKELLLRPSGNESVNFAVVYFSVALNEGYKFHVFFPQILVKREF